MRYEIFEPLLDRFAKGAVMRIGHGAPLGEGTVCAALEVVRVQPEYNADGDMVGGAVWVMVKPIGYEVDFEATRTYRFESLVETPDLVTGKTADGTPFLFTVPEGSHAKFYQANAAQGDTGALDSALTLHHKDVSMKWTGPDELEDSEEDELEELVNP